MKALNRFCRHLIAIVGIFALVLQIAQPSRAFGQRLSREGVEWLKWATNTREKYVLGYAWGYSLAYAKGCHDAFRDDALTKDFELIEKRCTEHRPKMIDVPVLSQRVTDFYEKYPDSRDLRIYEILEKLQDRLAPEQIHDSHFSSHDPLRRPAK